MNRRLVAVLCFALVVASITSFLVYRLILVRVGSEGKTVASGNLFVAKHDLQVGTLIQDSDVVSVPWGSPIPGDAAKTAQNIVGRGVIATIYENEPILEGRLAARGAGAGLAATIPLGMRAVALRVNEIVGLAGFVLPGMRVDVLIAGNVPGSPTTLCRTVLQNIEVLSAGQSLEKNKDDKPESVQVVNLLVTPIQAETLNLASEARVQLVLRNPLDTKSATLPGTSIAELYGVSDVDVARYAPPPNPNTANSDFLPEVRPVVTAAPRQSPGTTVEVFHGAKRTQTTFDAHGEPN